MTGTQPTRQTGGVPSANSVAESTEWRIVWARELEISTRVKDNRDSPLARKVRSFG